MPCEQPLKLGKTRPHGLALIVFSAKSTLTLGLSLLGEPLPRGINDLSLNQDNHHLNSQPTVGRRMKAVLCDVAVSCGFPLIPGPVPTSLNTNVSWSDKGWCDPGPERGRLQQSWGKGVCRDTSLRWDKKLSFLWSCNRTCSFHWNNFDFYPHPLLSLANIWVLLKNKILPHLWDFNLAEMTFPFEEK